jgi:hypothetical protein
MVKVEFEKQMAWFTEFYDTTLNKTQTIRWFEMFEQFSEKTFENALKAHIRMDDQPFFPPLSKIYNRCETWKKQ